MSPSWWRNMKALHLLLLLLSISRAAIRVTAYSSGAPNNKNVCSSLIPGHGSKQNALSPYKLIHSENMEGQIVVNLVATSQVTFAGFIVQARDADDLEKVIDGEFGRSEGTQVRSCFTGKSNTWTHASGQTKTQVTTGWTPPARYNGSLVFKGTVVQVKQAYWDQITSEPVYFLNGLRVDQKEYLQNHHALSHDEGTSEPLATSLIDYESCAERLCIGLGGSDDCLGSKSCAALLTARQELSDTDFIIYAKPSGEHKSKYYSMAFSEDDKMGDDLVVDCYADSTGKVELGLSYNHGKSNEVLNVPNLLQDTRGRYSDGIITCKWKIGNRNFVVNGKEYDLTDRKYHILLAHGMLESDNGDKSYHDIRTRSPAPVDLASTGALVGKDLTYLIRIHGSLMVISWLGTVSVAIIFARYFKDAWEQKLMCNVKIWFAFHRGLMVLSVTLMVVAQICIFYYVGGYRFGAHQALGSVAFAFALLQPLGALLRPHPDAPNRWLFNWMHWFGGNAGHITAAAAILLASKLKLAALPDSFLYVVMAWIIFHVVSHFIFQFHTSCLNNSKTSDIALHEMRNGERIYIEKGASSAGSGFKSFLLVIYILVVLLLITILVMLITVPGAITEKVPFL